MDLFYCERFKCRMSAWVCLARQVRARTGNYNEIFLSFEECLRCKQGERLRKEKNMGRQISFEEKAMGLNHPCVECGENEAIVDKQGKVTNGLCKGCFSAKRAAVKSSIQKHSLKITLDFAGHEKALEGIEQRANRQLRTIEKQIMWDVIQMADDWGAAGRAAYPKA